MKRLIPSLTAALIGTALFAGLLSVDFYRSLDSRFYDLLLRIKPAVAEDDSILLVEVDDQTISEVNMYPLSRDIFADGLILMKEFDPAWTMLDIEFVDRSPAGINLNYLEYRVPQELFESIDTLIRFNDDLVRGILSGSIDRTAALEYLQDFQEVGSEQSDRLYEAVQNVALDKDEYLGRAIAYLGDVSATINMTEDFDQTIPEELRRYAETELAVNDYLDIVESPFSKAVDILPSIEPVTESAAWAGFPRMHIDPDGVRRRVDVLYEHDGRFYTHMGFGTWWLREGRPRITVHKERIIVGDHVIPLDHEGKMLINWPKRRFDGTPLNPRLARDYDPAAATHRLSFVYLYYHDLYVRELADIIEEMEFYGYSSDFYGTTNQPLSAFAADLQGMADSMLASGDGNRAGEYGGYRDEYFSLVRDFLEGDAVSYFLSDLEYALTDPGLTADDEAYYADLAALVPELVSEALWRVDNIEAIRSELKNRLKDATIVVGYTGTSTTDYGANPFEERYMNMGIYGAVYNSLLQDAYLSESPFWLTVVITFVAALIVAVLGLVALKHSGLNTALGLAALLLIIAGAGAAFVFTGFYVNMLPLLMTLLVVYIAAQASNYLLASREKAFIQGAFGQIISPEVVKVIQDNPDRLNISGESRVITAMFTDIEKFSTISEHLGSSDLLFEFLKRYLTPMSDIILDEQGTIDKYEGDAIIAFWNAPLDQDDHVHRACRAAMRMVKKEQEINQELIDEGLLNESIMKVLPHGGLFTRVGINTGENNIGFIGTERRKDYTSLGDEMNLAARLEGVNKLYGTQVLISGPTEKVIHSHFITRRLDRVRVVGKEKPVALHELSYFKRYPEDYRPEELEEFKAYYRGLKQDDYRNDVSPVERECFNYYRDALDLFYEKQWDESESLFRKVLDKLPNDGPANVFVGRCQEYRKNPPPANWDGVYKMQTK